MFPFLIHPFAWIHLFPLLPASSACWKAWRAATERWSVRVKQAANLGRHQGQLLALSSASAPASGLPGITTTHTPPPPTLQALPRLPRLPLQLIISICKDRRSSGMQMRRSAGMHIYSAAGADGGVWALTPGAVFNFYINPETTTCKHRREGFSAPYVIQDPYYWFTFVPHERLVVFVRLLASWKDVVGEIACRSFDTTPFCLVNKRLCVAVSLKAGVCLCGGGGGCFSAKSF